MSLPDPLARFVDAVLASPDLQHRLAVPLEADAFARCAVAAAAELGLAIDPAMLRGSREPIVLPHRPPAAWRPVAVVVGERPAINWLWFGDRPLDDPFYEDSIRRVRGIPFARFLRIRTALPALLAGAPDDAWQPAGLVFHMSRCGSTLVAQMLGRVPGHVVLSEPEPLDAILSWVSRDDVAQGEKVAAVRAIVAALGGGGGRVFVKLDAWHTAHIALLRAAFPATPWVYLFRDPVEVMASHMCQPGSHMVAGGHPARTLRVEAGNAGDREDHCARVLAAIGRNVLANWEVGGGLVVDYATLGEGGLERIAAHFGVPDGAETRRAIGLVRESHAKHPGRRFHDDGPEKRLSASHRICAAVDLHLDGIHYVLRSVSRL